MGVIEEIRAKWMVWVEEQMRLEQEGVEDCIPSMECECPSVGEWRHGV